MYLIEWQNLKEKSGILVLVGFTLMNLPRTEEI